MNKVMTAEMVKAAARQKALVDYAAAIRGVSTSVLRRDARCLANNSLLQPIIEAELALRTVREPGDE